MTLADDFTSFSVYFDYYVTLYVSTVELEGHLRCFGTVSEMLLHMVMVSLCVVIVKKSPFRGLPGADFRPKWAIRVVAKRLAVTAPNVVSVRFQRVSTFRECVLNATALGFDSDGNWWRQCEELRRTV